MNASSESGLWATWMVVIGGESLRSSAGRGERGVDVVLVQEVLGQARRALDRFRGDEPGLERPGARVVPLHASRARGEEEPEQVGRPGGEDGVGLGAGERGIATHFTQPAEVVPLIEIE